MPDYTEIFEALGVFARAFATFDNIASRDLEISEGGETFRSLDRLRQQFAAVLNDSPHERDALQALTLLNTAAETARGWSVPLDGALDAWIRGALAHELNATGASREQILQELTRAMHADSQSVAANDVAVGAVSAAASNAGDAACYVTGETVDAGESVIADERVRNQRVLIECTRDNARHRVPVGQEEFRIRPEHGQAVGARVVPVSVGALRDPRNAVQDGAFHDGLEHWEVVEGASVFDADEALKLFGAGSLKITGDGATEGELRQDFANREPALESGRFFALGAWVYVASHAAGSVIIDLLVDGQPSALALTVDGSTATEEWLHIGGFEYLPRASFPNKVQLRVRCGSDFDGVIHVDGISVAPATPVPHAGLKVALFQGAKPPQAAPIADRYTVDTSSDEAGSFQTFARDRLATALPSSETPTINDNLA